MEKDMQQIIEDHNLVSLVAEEVREEEEETVTDSSYDINEKMNSQRKKGKK